MVLELSGSNAWESFEVDARTSLDGCEGSAARNTDVKGDSGKDAEGEEGTYAESLHLPKEHTHHTNRLLVETGTHKAILMGSQTVTRPWETGRKVIFVAKW